MNFTYYNLIIVIVNIFVMISKQERNYFKKNFEHNKWYQSVWKGNAINIKLRKEI